ncbi:MAG TPA: hypothetical protein VFT45_13590 [Longimicrobium sp.]|nr:hypothetical protein [Longimicrobium sp.]
MTSKRSIERSIDTLQRIYAVIAALAFNEALKRTFLQGGAGDVELDVTRIPEFVAFIVIAVPFLHGMNRHLDNTLSTIVQKNRRGLFVILLIDFLVFMLEACILFLLATSVKGEFLFFRLLILLLLVDLVWSFITWPITKSVIWRWAVVNVIAVILMAVLIRWAPFSDAATLWVLMSVSVVRTVCDYWLAWGFYFPALEEEAEPAAT